MAGSALTGWSDQVRGVNANLRPGCFALTGILLAYGFWGWALVTLAGAAANIVWAYRVYRATMR